jgi:two-component system chemotaxis sensor kinase CheA
METLPGGHRRLVASRSGGTPVTEPEFADLIPLFVSEARGRLERLALLVPRLGDDPEAVVEARRELHTLKGAGRMLRLSPLSELCHAAENALQPSAPAPVEALVAAIDGLAAMVDEVAGGGTPEPRSDAIRALQAFAQDDAASAPRTGKPPSDVAAALQEVRIESGALDAMTERATRLRILAQGADSAADRLHELARLADRGVHEPHPDQVLAVLSASIRSLAVWVEGSQRRLRRTADTQLEATLNLQLEPIRPLLLQLARHARDLARSLGRELKVDLSGEDTRLDRRIVRELADALLHTVRNAVDHGIESPEQRRRAGKPEAGTLRLEAAVAGRRVRLVIVDDGAGIEPARIAAQAVRHGLIDEKATRTLSRAEAMRLLFAPGFSTREEVSDVSGRGVGLDAVAAAVHRVGGRVDLDSAPGVGTTVMLEVPVARRGEQLVVARVGRLRVALPRSWIRRVTAIPADEVVHRSGRSFVELEARLTPLAPLATLFGEEPAEPLVVMAGELTGQPFALAVDAVEGEVEALVHPTASVTAAGPFVEGLALLPSGEPIAVLGLLALAQHDLSSPAPRATARAAVRSLGVLLVEDSLVTREMERRLLEDAGLTVSTAGDAAEALARLGERPFDCLIADIEMPGMDGLELTRRIRGASRLAQLPVVVVSTRDRPEDRIAALEAGADAYFSKKTLDAAELVGLIRRLAGQR